jgi:hypothetical protein
MAKSRKKLERAERFVWRPGELKVVGLQKADQPLIAHFRLDDDGAVEVRYRPEASGLIGDAVARIGLGQDFRHVPYHELVAHGAGRIQIDPVTGAGTI